MNEMFWHARRMLGEFNYGADETPAKIEGRCKPKIERRFREELTGLKTGKPLSNRFTSAMRVLGLVSAASL
jgi:hypothetical protein